MIDLSLEWKRCPDGVALVDYGPPRETDDAGRQHTILGQPKHGLWWESQSDRRIPKLIEAVDLENPVCLQFLNADSVEKQREFFERFGMLSPYETETKERTDQLRGRLEEALIDAVIAAPSLKSKVVNSFLSGVKLTPSFDFLGRGGTGRIVLAPKSLWQFICAEVAFAGIRDVGIKRCEGCDRLFFRGIAARRRVDAKTCSGRCRTAKSRHGSTASA